MRYLFTLYVKAPTLVPFLGSVTEGARLRVRVGARHCYGARAGGMVERIEADAGMNSRPWAAVGVTPRYWGAVGAQND